MKVSVIVASYRRPAMLRQCLASLSTQSRLPDEVIVVTKAHDPLSGETARAFAGECRPAWRLVSVEVTENSIVVAENAGLRAAGGDVVCFLDDDAAARPEWLAGLLAHYRDERVGAVGGRDVLYLDGAPYTAGQAGRVGQVTWYGRAFGNHHLGAEGVCDVSLLKGVNMSVRRCLVTEIDPRLKGDVTYHWEDDLCLGIKARGYRVLYDPEAIVDHYAGRGMADRALESPRIAFETNHNLMYVLLKHLPPGRKAIAFVYGFLVGDGSAWGIASVIRSVVSGRQSPRFAAVLKPALAGKLAGLRDYLARARSSENRDALR